MKQLAEIVPLVLFFITYQMKGTEIEIGGWSHTLDGIFSATAVLIIATIVQVMLTWILTRRLEKRLLWLLAAVSVFGGATLIFRDQTFIFWKPTVFNWALALVFGGSHFLGERNLISEPPAPVFSSDVRVMDCRPKSAANRRSIWFTVTTSRAPMMTKTKRARPEGCSPCVAAQSARHR